MSPSKEFCNKFTKQDRIRTPSQLKYVAQRGSVESSNWFKVNKIKIENKGRGIKKNQDLEARSRLGIIVNKKALRNAVERNKFKRIAKEFFRHRQRDFNAFYDVVINVQEAPPEKSKKFYLAEIEKLFRKGKML